MELLNINIYANHATNRERGTRDVWFRWARGSWALYCCRGSKILERWKQGALQWDRTGSVKRSTCMEFLGALGQSTSIHLHHDS